MASPAPAAPVLITMSPIPFTAYSRSAPAAPSIRHSPAVAFSIRLQLCSFIPITLYSYKYLSTNTLTFSTVSLIMQACSNLARTRRMSGWVLLFIFPAARTSCFKVTFAISLLTIPMTVRIPISTNITCLSSIISNIKKPSFCLELYLKFQRRV